MRPASPARVLVLGLFASSLGACSGSSFKSRGAATPTVAGEARTDATDPVAARAAFTRSGGPLTAVLEDASWIRLEPDPARAEERHPEYFRGLTVVDVELKTNGFVQPTAETYLLEDSTGARVTAKPVSYKGDTLKDFGPKHYAQFTLVFPHVLSKDCTWLRLTREGAEGGKVEWDLTR
jgi:hypothetical protein